MRALPTKFQLITELYDQTVQSVTGSYQSWTGFLRAACYNYKCPFDDQILIYAQRPDATAVLEMERWNRQFGRWVNRGAKSIAVFGDDGQNCLKLYFDVSDTHASRFARPLPIWTMHPVFEPEVIETLEATFGNLSEKENLADAVRSACHNAVADNITDYLQDLRECREDSLLEELDDLNLEVFYRDALEVSVAYMLMTRMGLRADDYFTADEFAHVYEFNTPPTVNALGIATSDIAEMGLREISRTVMQAQRDQFFANRARIGYDDRTEQHETPHERSEQHGGHLQDAERLSGAEPADAADAGGASGQVRGAASAVPDEAPQGALHQPENQRQADGASLGDRADLAEDGGAGRGADGESRGRDGGTESDRSPALGGPDEQSPAQRGGAGAQRLDLRLTTQEPTEAGSDELPASAVIDAAQPTIKELFEQYKQTVAAALVKDTAFVNACRNSDRENAIMEGADAIRRIVNESGDLQLAKLYFDMPAFHNRLHQELLEETYPKLVNAADHSPFKPYQVAAYHHIENGFDDMVAFAKAEGGLQTLAQEYHTFLDAYAQDRDIMRWRLSAYNTHRIGVVLDGLTYPERSFTAQPSFLRQCKMFITQDEIDHYFLREGVESRLTIYSHFCYPHTPDEHQKFIKGSFGEYSGGSRAGYQHTKTSKGLDYERDYNFKKYDTVHLTIPNVVKEYERLIAQKRFPGEDAIAKIPEYERGQLARTVYNGFYNAPDDVPRPYPKGTDYYDALPMIEEQLQDKGKTAEILAALTSRLDGTDESDRSYDSVRHAREQLSAYVDGTFSLFNHRHDAQLVKAAEQTAAAQTAPDTVGTVPWEPTQLETDTGTSVGDISIGTRLAIDGRQFEVDSVDDHTQNVSLRDVTFEGGTGFPIFRKESIDYVRAHMEQPDMVRETAAPQTDKPPAVLTPPKKKRQNALAYPLNPNGGNYRITDDHIGEGAPLERFQRNLDAIRTLKTVETENRTATAEEQTVLAQYVGWGGLAEFFDEKNARYAELKDLLTDAEYAAARESTLTAFYTPPVVIRGIYAALGQMGFTQGNILEPSCGIGNFLGMLPESMSGSKLYGVELDDLSGRIARQLYQKSSIAVQGYEKTVFPDNFFDVAIGNVPFGQFHVADKRYDRLNFPIHEYFIAKALDQVRPGGVIAVVTSSYTMDKRTASARKYIAQRAELLGAIRLPNNTFKSAAGTEVVSDILFLQKRERMVDIEPEWVHLATNEDGIQMNSYFIDHPDMILGEMKMVSGPFGPTPTCEPYPEQPLEALLAEAVQNVHGEITAYDREEELEGEDHSIEADPAVRNFSYTLVDGQIYYRENSRMNPVEVSKTAESRIRGMIELRDCVRTLLEYQTEDYPDEEIKAQQVKLNTLYDAFTRKYGLINSRGNAIAFDQDSSYFLLCSLEILDEDRNLKRKADLFTKRTIRSHKPAEKVDTAVEALALSIGEKAHVDMDYMGRLTGKDEETLFAELTGVVFLNPDYAEGVNEKYLPADEYLSGNVRQKLAVAQGKAEQDPQYQINTDALARVQPTDLTASEISVRLGATWLDTDYVRQFIFETLGTPRSVQWGMKVHYSKITGEWRIEGKSKDRGNVKAISTYGTQRINAYEIIETTLNLKDVRIFDYHYDEEGRRIAVLNKKETAIAQSKQELIKDAFAEWIWKDPDRREAICKTYNILFNSNRPREYDGSHINFSGMNPEITLRKHQVNAIAHILYGGNTLLAHVVGAGKTFEMVAAAMESKRLGLCQKSLFVVPNHLTEQWATEFLQLYPAANILVATRKDFETKNRKKFCGRIATGDYDAVIIGHSQFEKIPMSVERQRAILEQQIDEIMVGISDAKREKAENFTIKQMEKTKKGLQAKIDKLNDQSRKDDVVTFEELGIDRIFIDESHYFKNRAKRCA